MNKKEIESIQKINSEIDGFNECYAGNELWGSADGPVSAEKLIEFLVENPVLQSIADNIARETIKLKQNL